MEAVIVDRMPVFGNLPGSSSGPHRIAANAEKFRSFSDVHKIIFHGHLSRPGNSQRQPGKSDSDVTKVFTQK